MSALRKEAEALNIMHFRLVSGDEIIALVNRNKHTDPVLIVEEPLEIVKIFNGSDSYTVSFQEWMPFSESRLSAIQRNNIVAYAKCNLDTKEQYLIHVINLAQEEMDENPPEEIENTEEDITKDTVIH